MKNLILLTFLILSLASCKDNDISKADLIGTWDVTESTCNTIPAGSSAVFTEEIMSVANSGITYEIVDDVIINTFLNVNTETWKVTFSENDLNLQSLITDCHLTLSK